MNLNPLPPPAEASELLKECMSEEAARTYPDYEYRDLKGAVGSFYGLAEEEVVPLNGSSEGVLLALLATGARKVVAVQPSYGEHRDLAEALGLRYEPLFMRMQGSRFTLDVDDLRRPCADPDALIILANPNNPTGSFMDPRALGALSSECRSWLLLDEAYAELSEAYPGVRPYLGERTIVLRSLTKWLSVPGLRIGFAAAEKEVARRMDVLRAPWNVNSIAECFARAALGGIGGELLSYITASRRYISVERSRVSGRMSSIGLEPFESRANFLLIRHRRPADELAAYLRSKGISIREAWTFEGLDRTFFRVAIKSREEDDILLEALEVYLDGA